MYINKDNYFHLKHTKYIHLFMKKKLFIVKIFMDRKLKDRKVGFLLGRTEIYKSIIKKTINLKD